MVHRGKGFCDSLAPCRKSTPHWKFPRMTKIPFLYLIYVVISPGIHQTARFPPTTNSRSKHGSQNGHPHQGLCIIRSSQSTLDLRSHTHGERQLPCQSHYKNKVRHNQDPTIHRLRPLWGAWCRRIHRGSACWRRNNSKDRSDRDCKYEEVERRWPLDAYHQRRARYESG